jgi:2-polyprenyl-3-methyl-5-hydroxy-6-metoxy-1,4-benzoquinol methylase
LRGYDWTGYLRCSVARVVRVQRALDRYVRRGGAVLDFGSYFGNFALAIAGSGYRVTAADAYRDYGGAFDACTALMRGDGIAVIDSAEAIAGRFDAIVCAGVIEHIPHTPRLLLEHLSSLLLPGGVLIVDTPNIAYLYHRLALMEGRSIFAPLDRQFFTELPFEGHHREYTLAEVEWMLRASGHEVLTTETFNYSYFSLAALSGDDLAYFHAMAADPSLREIIFSVSRRRAA